LTQFTPRVASIIKYRFVFVYGQHWEIISGQHKLRQADLHPSSIYTRAPTTQRDQNTFKTFYYFVFSIKTSPVVTAASRGVKLVRGAARKAHVSPRLMK
jgi:hypothetical protein